MARKPSLLYVSEPFTHIEGMLQNSAHAKCMSSNPLLESSACLRTRHLCQVHVPETLNLYQIHISVPCTHAKCMSQNLVLSSYQVASSTHADAHVS